MRHSVLSAAALLVLVVSMSANAQPPTETQPRVISVTGHGKVTAPPNSATIRTGVTTHAATAKEALDANSKQLRSVMSTLEEFKIAESDMQTTNFNVHPEYQRNQRGGEEPRVIGYRVTNELSVRVRELDRLGAILDALVKAGSNQMSGVTFEIDKPEQLNSQARRLAVRDAFERAQLYADAAEVEVGRVISISEQQSQTPPPMPMMRAMAAESSVPVAAGEQELSASVSVVFELRDR